MTVDDDFDSLDSFDAETPDEDWPLVELVISTGGKRVYRVGDDYYPSVTTLLRAVAKPALPGWAARSVAEWVSRNLDTVAVLGAADTVALIDTLKGVPWRIRDDAAARGSEAHRLIAAGVLAETRPNDDPLRPLLEHYEQWLVDSGATVLATELPVASARYGWAGTIDAVVDVAGSVGLVDLKTSRSVVDRDGRLYPEMPLQLAAYAGCEIGHDFDLRFGSVLHLSLEGCTEHPAFVAGAGTWRAEHLTAAGLSGVPELDELIAVMQAVKTLADHLGMGATL